MSNSPDLLLPAASALPSRNPSDVGVAARNQRNDRSSGKGRRRRAAAEQRRADEQRWSHLVHDGEEDIYVAPPRPPVSRRQMRRAARRASRVDSDGIIFLEEEEDDIDVALAISLSLSETGNSGLSHSSSSEHVHLDMSYENLVRLENVKCTAPPAIVSSLRGHIFKKGNNLASTKYVEEKGNNLASTQCVEEFCTICQNDLEDGDDCMLLPCFHMLHDGCGSEWFLNHSKLCPVCKNDITESP